MIAFDKTIKRLVVITLLLVVFYYIYFSLQEHRSDVKLFRAQNKFVQKRNSSSLSKNKTILYWDTFHGVKDMGLGFGNKIFQKCAVSGCYATNNRHYIPVEDFDAIIFHGARYNARNDGIPKYRKYNQKYIFFSKESAFNTYFEPQTNVRFYNWTMTFKRDSDIYYPYGICTKKRTDYVVPTISKINNKTKKVAWFVSNCRTGGSKRRSKYAKELSKYIPLDIYGECGTLKCPLTDANNCYHMLEDNYKFYLSFENSLCEDYVTEKLFNIMKYNIIPVVLGFADYKGIVPEKSIINTNDFINPKYLAEYLWYLDENTDEYLKYFQWKKDFVVNVKTEQLALCQLCEKLHEPIEYSYYENIRDWYFGFRCAN